VLGLYRAFGLRSQRWDYRRLAGADGARHASMRRRSCCGSVRAVDQWRFIGIRIAVSYAAAGGALAVAVALAASSGDAYAQGNVLKECGSQYQAAKAANELGGQSWQEFLKACRGRLAEQAKPGEEKPAEAKPAEAKPETPPPAAAESKPTPPPATEAKPAAPARRPKRPRAPNPRRTRNATRERQKKCAAEWKRRKLSSKRPVQKSPGQNIGASATRG
jgi:outer membrane biosynthesis protein TonB